MTDDGVVVTTLDGKPVQKEVVSVPWSPAMAEKGGYKHFMLKEIYEQPRAIADTLRGRFYPESGPVNMDEFGIKEEDLKKAQKDFHYCLRHVMAFCSCREIHDRGAGKGSRRG